MSEQNIGRGQFSATVLDVKNIILYGTGQVGGFQVFFCSHYLSTYKC